MKSAPPRDLASEVGYAIRTAFEYACYIVIGLGLLFFWIVT